MNNLLIILAKAIFGIKFGWLIIIIFATLFGLALIKNIISGTFSISKFASGFNPFTGAVQGKLIYYGLILFGCFVAYHFIMRPTNSYDTDYRNNIRGNQDVIIDQSVGAKCIPTKILWGVIQIGCKSEPINKTVNNNCDCKTTEVKK